MRKITAMLMAMVLMLSLVACGGEPDDKPVTTPTTPPVSDKKEEPKKEEPKKEEGKLTAEQQKLNDNYTKMLDDYNKAVDEFNKHENLVEIESMVNVINELSTSIDEASKAMEDVASFTAEQITAYDEAIKLTYAFIEQVNSLAKNYGSKTAITIKVTLQNETGADLSSLVMSPTSQESWGNNLLTEPLLDGQSGETSMIITEDSLQWDLMAADAEGTYIDFYGLDFSDTDIDKGAVIVLSASESGEYTATIQ